MRNHIKVFELRNVSSRYQDHTRQALVTRQFVMWTDLYIRKKCQMSSVDPVSFWVKFGFITVRTKEIIHHTPYFLVVSHRIRLIHCSSFENTDTSHFRSDVELYFLLLCFLRLVLVVFSPAVRITPGSCSCADLLSPARGEGLRLFLLLGEGLLRAPPPRRRP